MLETIKKCKICDSNVPNSKNTFCSINCYRVHQRSGEYKTTKISTKHNVNCKNCNISFLVHPWKIKFQNVFFCSKKCYLEDHATDNITKQCNGCGKDIKLGANGIFRNSQGQDKFYCSDECRSMKNRVLTCQSCGCSFSSFSYRKSNNKKGFSIVRPFRKTCSEKCHFMLYKTNEDRKEKISIAFSGDKHPNYVNGCAHNYRVRRTDIKENFSKRGKKKVFELFNNKCFNCGGDENLTVDHNVPFSRGGRLTLSNCVLLCRSCNSSKNAKLPTAFYTATQIKKLKSMGIDHNNLFNF